ncbi:hypothetical protein F5050DRAFT_981898 [Lentinula boryana]|uniref:TM7S3/TM198-like domain-containing protein n=1 Tax=Lentinula boryana TaxID=40481 RepID=A0ABQ8QLP2_9AGAR|nr:hypothetical protein F5050DRAFT_981898 [Lentinula boryana]
MTAVARPHFLLALWWLLSQLSAVVFAKPVSPIAPDIYARRTDPVVSHSLNGSIIILDPSTQQTIPQGPGTDGCGAGFSFPAIVWIVFLLVIGIPLAVAGIRGWRCTTGVSIGLAAMVCSWAAIINSVNEVGISDILLTLIVLAFGFLGLVIGFFEFARIVAMVILCLIGGLSFGMRITLLKTDLLFASLGLNWLIIVVLGVAGGLLLIWKNRIAMLIACASSGTFLTSLGIDLIFNQQSGLSFGLRSLFDSNDNHLAYFLETTYEPTLSTKIIVIASLGLTPAFVYAQHLLFKQPFTRRGPSPSDEELCLNYPTEDFSANRATAFFSGIWDGAKLKLSPSRFSL